MKNRASSHLIALLLIIGFEIVGYFAVHRAGLIRGYEPSWVSAVRDLLMYVPVVFLEQYPRFVDRARGAEPGIEQKAGEGPPLIDLSDDFADEA